MQRSVSAIFHSFIMLRPTVRGLTVIYVKKLCDEKQSQPQELQETRVDHLK